MKGVKMALDTKVQPNVLYANWQKTQTSWRYYDGYDKSVDAIVIDVPDIQYACKDLNIYLPDIVAGEVYTISFDAWGSTKKNNIRTHLLNTPDVLACAAGGDINGWNNGFVEWHNLSQKSKRYFTTYKLVEKSNDNIIIRLLPGTTYIRNIKLEKSPYPTDYEE